MLKTVKIQVNCRNKNWEYPSLQIHWENHVYKTHEGVFYYRN